MGTPLELIIGACRVFGGEGRGGKGPAAYNRREASHRSNGHQTPQHLQATMPLEIVTLETCCVGVCKMSDVMLYRSDVSILRFDLCMRLVILLAAKFNDASCGGRITAGKELQQLATNLHESLRGTWT